MHQSTLTGRGIGKTVKRQRSRLCRALPLLDLVTMSSINDMSNTDASLNSDTVPTSNIDRSNKYKYNPQTPAVAAPSLVSRPDKSDNRKGGVTSNSKGGAGAHNWYGTAELFLSLAYACLPACCDQL